MEKNNEGLDADAILTETRQPACQHLLNRHTDSAIEAGVFGVPSYVLEDEIFWGQDRLDLLARALEAR